MTYQKLIPRVIETYTEASNNRDLETMMSLFTPDATMFDEGKTYVGIEDIKQSKQKLHEQFNFHLQVIDFSAADGKILVHMNCEGNFPGSPIVFKNYFDLENGRIKGLKITE